MVIGKSVRSAWVGVACVACVLFSNIAHGGSPSALDENNAGQKDTDPSAAAFDNANDITDTVVVTASRTRTRLSELPQAVTVIDQQVLEEPNQGLGIDEWLNRSPGVFFQNRYNFAQNIRISIRGFGARAPFGVRGIQLINDGFPETLPDGQSQVDSLDLQSLVSAEVIRGPSSVLYGNAAGGVIALQTRDGEGLEPTVHADLGLGADGYKKIGLQAGGQWDRAHGWLSVSDLDFDGQRAHSSTSKRLLNANGVVALGPTQRLRLALSVLDQPFGQDPGALTREQVAADRWQASAQAESLNSGQTVRQERVGLAHEFDLSNKTTVSSYLFRSSRDFEQQLPSSFFPSLIAFQREFYGLGSSAQWVGPNGWRLTAGLDWAKQDDDRQRYRVNDQGLVVAQTQNERQQAESQAAFIQADRQWGDWSLQLGARYDDLRLTIDEFNAPAVGTMGQAFNEWSLMAGASYQLRPRLWGFVNYSEGFESPTFTEIKDLTGGGGFSRNLSPAHAKNYEVGLRAFWPDGQMEASLFQVDTRDEIVVVGAFDGVDIYDNAGKTDRVGFEFGMEQALSDAISWSMAYTYADYRFGQFALDGQSFDGNALPGLPDHTVFSQVKWVASDAWSMFLDALWVGSVFADNANVERVKSYGLVNWRAQYEHDLDDASRLQWSVGINNLFNQAYFSNIRVNANRGAYFEPGPGRAWFMGLTWQR